MRKIIAGLFLGVISFSCLAETATFGKYKCSGDGIQVEIKGRGQANPLVTVDGSLTESIGSVGNWSDYTFRFHREGELISTPAFEYSNPLGSIHTNERWSNYFGESEGILSIRKVSSTVIDLQLPGMVVNFKEGMRGNYVVSREVNWHLSGWDNTFKRYTCELIQRNVSNLCTGVSSEHSAINNVFLNERLIPLMRVSKWITGVRPENDGSCPMVIIQLVSEGYRAKAKQDIEEIRNRFPKFSDIEIEYEVTGPIILH